MTRPLTLGLPVREVATRLEKLHSSLRACVYDNARLVPAVPAIELKILLARHLYDDVLIVDQLSDRLASLGMKRLLDNEAGRDADQASSLSPSKQLSYAGFFAAYARLKDSQIQALRDLGQETNPLWDEPTVRLTRSAIAVFRAQLETLEACRLEFQRSDSLGDLLEDGARPARDARFRISDEAATATAKVGGQNGTMENLHLMLMSVEVPTIEACCSMITTFPDMPWDFVRDMARQCWDEARHADLMYQRLLELGGCIGHWPIDFQLWELTEGQPLALRLAAHQRLGEWRGVDGALNSARVLRTAGDAITARLFEYVAVDEITHVAFGNKWLRYLANGDQAEIDRMHALAAQRRAGSGKTVTSASAPPINLEACRLSGFTAPEVEGFVQERQAEFFAKGLSVAELTTNELDLG